MRTRREIEEQVDKLLRKHLVSVPPVNVDMLAEAEGLQIFEASLKGDVSGALIRNGDNAAIAVNSIHHPNRRRFTVAHELAHYLLSHKGDEDHIDWQFTVIRRDGASSEASDSQEIEANFFAASLLMPKDFLRRDVDSLLTLQGEPFIDDLHIASLARKYVVSEAAMRYRLMNLALLPVH